MADDVFGEGPIPEREPTPPPEAAPSGGFPGGAGLQPVPTPWTMGVAKVEGEDVIVLKIDKVTGTDVLFCPPEFAKQIATMLQEVTSGLTLPPSGLVIP